LRARDEERGRRTTIDNQRSLSNFCEFLLGALILAREISTRQTQGRSEDAIRGILRDRVDVWRQSVGMVAGVHDTSGRLLLAYGRAGAGNDRPLDGDAVFEIGSITKVFTALLLAEMAARREVALEDPVAKYLPSEVKVPGRGRKRITLLDLATYTSGLPRMPSNFDPKDKDNPYADYSVQQLYAFLSGYVLQCDPGIHYEYANLGFGLLGHALALRAGKSYEELVIERICAPLGMESTGVTLSGSMRERLTPGHNQSLEPTSNWDMPTLTGAGGLRSTANDLLTFLDAVSSAQTDTPLRRASERLLKTQRLTRGPAEGNNAALGWFVRTRPDDVIILKGGGTGGYKSFIGFSTWSRKASVVLSNAGGNEIDDIGLHLVNDACSLRQYPPQVAVDPAVLATYAGTYAVTPAFTLTIRASADRLFVRGTGQNELELFADAENRFFMRSVDAQAIFLREKDGTVRELIWRQNGKYQYCQLIP
jgi:D-alanyl-D-alanine-carboxypeptidase/D-alanyl-D-alanine-endopeptidase